MRQIELKLQNEALTLAKESADVANHKFTKCMIWHHRDILNLINIVKNNSRSEKFISPLKYTPYFTQKPEIDENNKPDLEKTVILLRRRAGIK